MSKKDQFIEWLREMILDNPQEPPAAAWEQISESLDIEEAWEGIGEELELDEIWQKVDHRLHRYEFLQLFERIGYGISGLAALLLLLGTFWTLNPSEGNQEAKLAIEDTGARSIAAVPETINPQGDEASTNIKTEMPLLPNNKAEDLSGESNNGNDIASSFEEPGRLGKTEKAGKQFPQTAGKKPVPAAATEETKDIVSGSEMEHSLAHDKEERYEESIAGIYPESLEDKSLEKENYRMPATGWATAEAGSVHGRPFMPFALEQASFPAIELADTLEDPKEINDLPRRPAYEFPAMVAGIGAAAKLSGLLNNKTREAIEKSSLTTAVPTLYTDVYVSYGMRLHPRYMLQADAYLLDWGGQRYQEYRNGTYGEVENKLLYRSLGLSLEKAGRQLSFGAMPLFSRYYAGVYGGMLRNAREIAVESVRDTRNEYANWHFGLQAGYGYDLYLMDQLMLSYGLRARMDVMNIYSGTEAIPASFRKTRNASLNFTLSLRYVLKK